MDSTSRKGSGGGSSTSSKATEGSSKPQSAKKLQTSKHKELGEGNRDEKLKVVRNDNARLSNPYESEMKLMLTFSLAGLSTEEVMSLGEQFAINAGLTDHVDDFRKGALVAQAPKGFDLTDSH